MFPSPSDTRANEGAEPNGDDLFDLIGTFVSKKKRAKEIKAIGSR